MLEKHEEVNIQSYEITSRNVKEINFYEDDIYFAEKLLQSLDTGNKIFIPNTRKI